MRELKLIVKMGGCTGSSCPAVYEDGDAQYYVQGKIVSNEIREKLNVPMGEDVVSIPKKLLDQIK